MILEEILPEKFKIVAFHPSLFIYAWKKTHLDKLFEELLASNIAIISGEAWVTTEDKYFGVIPLRKGGKEVLSWKIRKKEKEEWYDFVERSVKESLTVISEANLENKVTSSVRHKLYYHFEFAQE